jgi:bacterioferritin-associated ferredoxin
MIVCYCKSVTEKQILDAVRNNELEDLHERRGPGTGCGSCRDFLREIIIQEIDNLEYGVDND